MLKDPVGKGVTRCCMTREEFADASLTCKMSAVMKVRWWELKGIGPEDVKEERKWVNQKRGSSASSERSGVESAKDTTD